MSDLAAHLRRRIGDLGPIGVDAFMADALGHPEFGYYMARDPFGARGDFITAPEVSQMFGELIGLWCAVQWQAMGRPDPVTLVEFGPGRGTLMADALRAAAGVPGFLPALDVVLIEISPALKELQNQTLQTGGHAGAVRSVAWNETLGDIGAGPMLVIANEFLDALPVRQFVFTEDGWRERLVDVDAAGGGFRFVAGGAAPEPGVIPVDAGHPEPGAVFEVRPGADALAGDLARRLVTEGGAALFVDYGHVRSAFGDTLQAVRGHEFAEPLAAPGLADLTAHVDFDALKRAAGDSGASAFGPVDQGDFLIALGLEARTEALSEAAPERAAAFAAARERLAGGAQMGRLFKALALTDPALPRPPGFS